MSKVSQFLKELHRKGKQKTHHTNRKKIEVFAEHIFDFLFQNQPIYHCENRIETQYERLKLEFTDILISLEKPMDIQEITNHFFEQIIPDLYQELNADATFFCESDPAARSLEEVYLTYPGFFTIAIYRMAHQLYLLGVALLPRVLTEYAHGKTGIDIHPGAKIGVPFFIDHGTGTVIGETTCIGNRVKIYQGVTLGALVVSKEKANEKRHPSIEDDVIIYSGATILGGETVIGKGSVIGGNAWIIRSVEPMSKVFYQGQIKVKASEVEPYNIYFEI